jgi:hypothetical protein
MKNWHWILIGAVVGIGSGAIFGQAYMLAGLGIGLIAGAAIMFALR